MNKVLSRLMVGGSVAAITAASMGVSYAQDSAAGDIESVTVSASRISIAGYTAPTPVTVVGAAMLEAEAKNDIGDSIRELPAVQGASPQAGSGFDVLSGAPAGQSNVSLRNLGTLRTLVLVDGQRVVTSNVTGGVDLNTIPTALVQRVDVVTGGASAAWGSDAVAGVINLILNKNFTGFKAEAEFSDNHSDQYRTAKVDVSYGTDFDGDRGHFILSGGYNYSPDAIFALQNSWYNKVQLFPNTAYNATTNPNVPQLIREGNVGQALSTQGGIITASPKGTGATPAAANALRGIDFIGQAALPTPVNFGNLSGPAAVGGDLGSYDSNTVIDPTALPSRQATLFAYGSYKLSNSTKLSVQLNYGNDWAEDVGTAAQNLGTLTIQSDNAYLPASVKAAMTAGGITSFNLGTNNINNVNVHNMSFPQLEQSLGVPVGINRRQQLRGVVTLDGELGDDWSWNAFVNTGQTKIGLRVIDNSLLANIPLAADAVTVTAANVAASGLGLGSIACRSTLAAPTNGCKPLDVFGTGNASQLAINYIDSVTNPDREDITVSEADAGASLQGTLPWQMPAGPVAVATGAEVRHEIGRIVADPRGATAQWGSANFANMNGGYEVEEGFVEVDAPLLKNQVINSLNFNAAGRITNYSTSGLVETWKIGAVAQLTDDVRLRTVWSTDIRAPNLAELFTAHAINTGTNIDLNSPSCTSTTLNKFGYVNSIAGCSSPFTANDKAGNPNLVPETGRTITAGLAYTPSFIPGLQLAFDWYNISVAGAIVSVSGSPTNCAAALSSLYCSLLVFNGPAYSNGKPTLTKVLGVALNANSERVSGVDMQADYSFDFLTGTMALAYRGTYLDEHTIINIGVVCDQVGQVGLNGCGGDTIPKFKGTLGATYTEGPLSLTVQSRFQGSYVLNNTWTSGVNVDKNSIDPNAYLDLRGSYKWTPNIQVYGAIDDVLDTPPILVPPLASTGTSYQSLGFTGDNLGRVMRVGVRLVY